MIHTYQATGTQIGNYLIEAHLATGGFGSVYRGRHKLLKNRMVAIKLLQEGYLTSQKERDRFLHEAFHLEQLKHPCIVPILDAGVYENTPYIVTPYLPNGSLEDRLAGQFPHTLPVEEAMRILSQVGQALHTVHCQNIIHRDLKPANILLSANGEALLTDFGAATSLANTSTRQTTTLLGTLAYMAPEQFQGVISKEGDQYALACIAYRLFTGYVPFRATDFPTLMHQHIYEAPVDPGRLNPDLPLYIREAILKAMAKERAARHRDVATFLAAMHIPPFQRTDALAPMLCLPQCQRSTDSLNEAKPEHLQTPAVRPVAQGNAPERRQPLETILDSLHTGIITTDASGIITTWNTAASALLHLNQQGVVGKHYRDVFRIRPYTDLAALLQDALLQDEQDATVTQAVDWSLGGEPIHLRFSVSLLRMGGKRNGLMLAIEDYTEQTGLQGQVEEIRRILELYVSPDVVEQFLYNPYTLQLGGETQEISVLFADIRNSTGLGERLTPERLTEVLNTYLEIMALAVCEEEGIVTGFQGDGLMAIFNAPLSQPDHALLAVRAAWKMRQAVLAHQQAHQEELPISIGIGVNTGKAVVGNFGARGLIQNYTAVGDTVNVAARLQALASNNAILLNHSTFTHVRHMVNVDLLASLEVKNREKRLDVWILQGIVGV